MVKVKRVIGFLLILLAVTVIFLGHRPTEFLSQVTHLDKVVHFGLFFCLAWSMDWSFRPKLWVSLLILCAYGLLIEIIQSYIPGLVPDLYDWLADASGAMSYFLFSFVRQQLRTKNAN